MQFGAFRLPPSLSPPSLFPSPPVADVAAVNHVPTDRLWPAPPGPARSSRPRHRARPTALTGGHRPGAPAARSPRTGPGRGLPRPARPASALRRAWRLAEPLAARGGARWGGDIPSPTAPFQPRWSRRCPLPAGQPGRAGGCSGGGRVAEGTGRAGRALGSADRAVRGGGTPRQQRGPPGRGDGEGPGPGGGHASGGVRSLRQLLRPCCPGSQIARVPPACGRSWGAGRPESPGRGIGLPVFPRSRQRAPSFAPGRTGAGRPRTKRRRGRDAGAAPR